MDAVLLLDPAGVYASPHLAHDNAIGNDGNLVLGQAVDLHQLVLHPPGGHNNLSRLIASLPLSMRYLLGYAVSKGVPVPTPFSAMHGQQEGQMIVALYSGQG